MQSEGEKSPDLDGCLDLDALALAAPLSPHSILVGHILAVSLRLTPKAEHANEDAQEQRLPQLVAAQHREGTDVKVPA